MKRILIILGIAVLIICVGFLLVDSSLYGDYLAQRISRIARSQGIILSLKEPRLSGLGVHAEKMNVFLPKQFIQLNFTDAKARMRLIPLLTLKGAGNITAKGYGGKWEADLYSDLDSTNVNADLSVLNVTLASHPQIEAFNLRGGSFTGDATDIIIKDNIPVEGIIKFGLKSLKAPSPIVIGPALTGLPMDIKIPAFQSLNLDSEASFNNGTLEISNAALAGSLGSATGKGKIDLFGDKRKRKIDLTFRISLSNASKVEFGDWLPLISQGKVTADAKSFEIAVSGTAQSPQVVFKPSKAA